MKKIDNKGFVLAETLVVTVFLMAIFSMIYYYFYPLIGEYEKREVYDDVDGKYSAYWIKRLIEDSDYNIATDVVKKRNFQKYGYLRFECRNVPSADQKKQMCKTLVNALQVEGCDSNGNGCNIFVTAYRIGDINPSSDLKSFKNTVARNGKNLSAADHALIRAEEDCDAPINTCKNNYINRCDAEKYYTHEECVELASKKVFASGFQEYVNLLPNYKTPSKNGALYRIIVSFQHRTDNNNYYSYATMEVIG